MCSEVMRSGGPDGHTRPVSPVTGRSPGWGGRAGQVGEASSRNGDVLCAGPADEIVRVLSVLARREDSARIYTELAATAGLELDPRSTWLLYRLDGRPRLDTAELANTLRLSLDNIHTLLSPLTRQGYVTLAGPSDIATVTPQGHAAIERLVAARRARLEARLGSWADEQDTRLARELDELARDLLSDPDRRQHMLTGPSTAKS